MSLFGLTTSFTTFQTSFSSFALCSLLLLSWMDSFFILLLFEFLGILNCFLRLVLKKLSKNLEMQMLQQKIYWLGLELLRWGGGGWKVIFVFGTACKNVFFLSSYYFPHLHKSSKSIVKDTVTSKLKNSATDHLSIVCTVKQSLKKHPYSRKITKRCNKDFSKNEWNAKLM